MQHLLLCHGVCHIGCLAKEIKIPPNKPLPSPHSAVAKRIRVKDVICFVKLASKAVVGLLEIESASMSISGHLEADRPATHASSSLSSSSSLRPERPANGSGGSPKPGAAVLWVPSLGSVESKPKKDIDNSKSPRRTIVCLERGDEFTAIKTNKEKKI